MEFHPRQKVPYDKEDPHVDVGCIVASLLVTEDMIEDFTPWNYVEKEESLASPPEPSPG